MGRIAAVAFLLFAACGSSAPATVALTDGGGDGAAGLCGHAFGLDDGGPGACHVGKRNLQCASGDVVCDCITDGDECGPCLGGTCHDLCNSNEYAVSCGGPPAADASVVYANPPEVCRTLSFTPGGTAFYCCPCQ